MFKRLLLYLWNFWPPFMGAGIKIDFMSADFKYIKIRLKNRPWTKNYVGVQYGGSIYSMTDPFYMVMLIMLLGKDYIVWDKSSSIRFRKPGKGELIAEFRLTSEEVEEIRNLMKQQDKLDWERTVLVKDLNNEIIAEVKKVLQIRNKKR